MKHGSFAPGAGLLGAAALLALGAACATPPAMGCSRDAECLAGQACVAGRCAPVEDRCADVACPAGQGCVEGLCVELPCEAGASRGCGPCGEGVETCGDGGTWGSCSGEGCAPGERSACGTGGTMTCGTDCSWGGCEGAAQCTAGEQVACGPCGTMTCGADGTWGSCTGAGVCSPGATASCSNCATKTCTSSCAWSSCSSSCSAGTVCSGTACVSCGGRGEPCCAGSCDTASLVCTAGTCRAYQVAVVSGSPEDALMATYPRLFGTRTLVYGSGAGFTLDEVRPYQESDRVATLRKAVLGEGVMAYSAPLRTDAGNVRVVAGSAEDTLMANYPKLFGTRTVTRDGAAGITVAGRHYQGADRYETLRLAMEGEKSVY